MKEKVICEQDTNVYCKTKSVWKTRIDNNFQAYVQPCDLLQINVRSGAAQKF